MSLNETSRFIIVISPSFYHFIVFRHRLHVYPIQIAYSFGKKQSLIFDRYPLTFNMNIFFYVVTAARAVN